MLVMIRVGVKGFHNDMGMNKEYKKHKKKVKNS